MLRFILFTFVVPMAEGVIVSWVLSRVFRRRIERRAMFEGAQETIYRLAPLLAGAGVPLADVERALRTRVGRSEAKPN